MLPLDALSIADMPRRAMLSRLRLPFIVTRADCMLQDAAAAMLHYATARGAQARC